MNNSDDPKLEHSQKVKSFKIGGKEIARTPCGFERGDFSEYSVNETECSECGAPTGLLHVLSCEFEQCPVCDEQAIGCSCDYDKRPEDL